jgi:hypothetical protein
LNLPGPISGSAGAAAYGTVPGPVGLPPNLWQQAGQAVPGIPTMAGSLAGVIGQWGQGKVSTGTQDQIQDYAASRGLSSGIPGMYSGGLFSNLSARDIGLTSEQLQQQALSAFPSFMNSIYSGMTDPNLAYQNEVRTSDLASAPNPTASANRNLDLYNQYMQAMYQSGGGPAGGTGNYSMAPSPFQATNPFTQRTGSGGTGYYGQGNYGSFGTSPYQVWSSGGGMWNPQVPNYDLTTGGVGYDSGVNPNYAEDIASYQSNNQQTLDDYSKYYLGW